MLTVTRTLPFKTRKVESYELADGAVYELFWGDRPVSGPLREAMTKLLDLAFVDIPWENLHENPLTTFRDKGITIVDVTSDQNSYEHFALQFVFNPSKPGVLFCLPYDGGANFVPSSKMNRGKYWNISPIMFVLDGSGENQESPGDSAYSYLLETCAEIAKDYFSDYSGVVATGGWYLSKKGNSMRPGKTANPGEATDHYALEGTAGNRDELSYEIGKLAVAAIPTPLPTPTKCW